MNKTEVMALLKENQNPRGIAHWERLEAASHMKSFGIGLTQLRKLAKSVGRDHKLAGQLWKSDVYDARIISLLIDDPKQITREQMEEQVENLDGGYLAHVFSTCGATLSKADFAFDLTGDWMESDDPVRRRCAWGLVYEFSKARGKKAPDETFFLDCIERIERDIHVEENMWVREAMNTALMGMGVRDKKLNKRAVKAARSIGPVDIDYGDDNACEPMNVLKHLTGDFVKKKLGL